MSTRGYGAWQVDYHDTIPTEPAELARLIRHIESKPGCGTCQQGRNCSTPTACECAESADDGIQRGAFVWPLVMALVICIVATLMVMA